MKSLQKIAMLSIHSNPLGDLGTRDTGGMSVFLRETAAQLAKMDLQVDIFTVVQGERESFRVQPMAEKVRLIELCISSEDSITKENLISRIPDIILAFRSFCRCQACSYDIIHSHYWLSALAGEIIADENSLPHCLTFHTLGQVKNVYCQDEAEPEVRILKEQQLGNNCDAIIAFTENEKSNLQKYYGISGAKITVIPCGVNVGVFRPVSKARKKLDLALAHGDRVLLYVGRIVPIKGFERLLQAITLLAEHDRVKLLVIGGDDYEEIPPHLRSDRESCLKRDVIVWQGRVAQEKLPVYYSAADALIVPSFHESFGLVVLESLACGTPVIGGPVGCIPEVVQPGMGVVLQSSGAKDLYEGMKSTLIDTSITLYSGQDIRQSVLKYSWQNTAEKVLKLYTSILKHKRSKPIESNN